jgi:hypothetical protein
LGITEHNILCLDSDDGTSPSSSIIFIYFLGYGYNLVFNMYLTLIICLS